MLFRSRPADVETAVGMKASVMIPGDRNVLAAANQGVPITVADPKSAISKKFQTFTETFTGIEVAGQKPKASFWRRAK